MLESGYCVYSIILSMAGQLIYDRSRFVLELMSYLVFDSLLFTRGSQRRNRLARWYRTVGNYSSCTLYLKRSGELYRDFSIRNNRRHFGGGGTSYSQPSTASSSRVKPASRG